MPPVANPLTKVRKRLEPCCFGPANFKNLPKDKDKVSDPNEHLSFYRKLVPIQREIVPKIDEALDLACERLGLNRDNVHGFVKADPEINAFCRDGIRGNAVIFVNSGMIEHLSMEELLYVMGHELGHYIMPLPTMSIPDGRGGHRPASMEDAIIHRKLEISMDRFGLVACRDLQVACSAALKIQSGLGSEHIRNDLTVFAQETIKGYVRDYKEYEGEAFSSHPAAYARIRALYHFSQSEEYLDLIGQKGGRPHAEIDAEVAKDLDATLDYYAGKLMEEAVEKFSHAVAALHLDMEGKIELSRYVVDRRFKPDADVVKALAQDLASIPAEERPKAASDKFAQLIHLAITRCPYTMSAHLEELLPKLEGTKVHAFASDLAKHFHEGLKAHRGF
jgi:hypothetical protein